MKVANEQQSKELIEKKVIELSEELYELERKFEAIEKKYKTKKNDLVSLILGLVVTNFEKNHLFKIKKYNKKLVLVRPKKIEFSASALKSKLGKEESKKYIVSEYSLNDFDGFISYMKKLNANPTKIKKFLNVNKSVNVKAIEKSYETGEMSIESLSGCYTETEKSPYVRFYDYKEE